MKRNSVKQIQAELEKRLADAKRDILMQTEETWVSYFEGLIESYEKALQVVKGEL